MERSPMMVNLTHNGQVLTSITACVMTFSKWRFWDSTGLTLMPTNYIVVCFSNDWIPNQLVSDPITSTAIVLSACHLPSLVHAIVCHWSVTHLPSYLEAISCTVPCNPNVLCQTMGAWLSLYLEWPRDSHTNANTQTPHFGHVKRVARLSLDHPHPTPNLSLLCSLPLGALLQLQPGLSGRDQEGDH